MNDAVEGWMFVDGDEWRRRFDGARVVKRAGAWDVVTHAGEKVGTANDANEAMFGVDAGEYPPLAPRFEMA